MTPPPSEETLVVTGVPVAPGLAVGQAVIHEEDDVDVPILEITADDVGAELRRLSAALRAVKKQLAEIERGIEAEVGARDARIFGVQGLLLEDPEFRKSMRARIRRQLVNAEVAVRDEVRQWVERLAAETDRDPAADLRDIGRQLLRHLAGKPRKDLQDEVGDGVERVILVCEEFLPSDAAQIDRKRLAGIVTASGGVASHAAILARNLGIPAVTSVDVGNLPGHGRLWIVDGNSGQVIVNPSRRDVKEAERRSAEYGRFRARLVAAAEGYARTADDVAIELLLNVEDFDALASNALDGLQGIGLYRTEFLFLNRPFFPTEEEQYRHYCDVLAAVGEREVTFRTIDVGGDKPLPYLSTPHEPNPVLGWRGIRLSLEWPDMFYTQIRALLRASAHGRMRVLLPMVSNVDEVRRVREIVTEVQGDLAKEGVAFDEQLPLGAMIEVPAAAMATRTIARHCDFLSVGTNDLSQYALAVDRNNARVADLYQPLHPGLIAILRTVLSEAAETDTPVCLCGELAGEPEATMLLLGLGLRSFSMSAFHVPVVKRLIRSVTLDDARRAAHAVLELGSTSEIRAELRRRALEHAPEFASLFGGPK